jgi:capsular polysaccharide biosynthesis protein
MDIKAYLAILWRNKWVILATTAVTVGVATALTLLSTPIYAASTTLRVASVAGTTGSYSDYVYTDRLMNTYSRIATSGPVLAELAERLDLQKAPEIQVETIPNTELIHISVEDADPKLAQAAANTLAEILIAQSKEFYSGGGKSPQEIVGEQLALAEAELNQARQEYENLVKNTPEDSEQIAATSQQIELK